MLSQILQLILQGVPLLQAIVRVLSAALNLVVSVAQAHAQFRSLAG